MFRDNRRYIAEDATRDDYINLNLNLRSPTSDWDKAIIIFQGRLRGRYLDPMNALVKDDVNKNGFAVMALCCLLIETLMQFVEGLPSTPSGRNKRSYSDFMVHYLRFNREESTRFYEDIRCGILHSAQTKNGSCLTFGTNDCLRIQGNGVLMVDVHNMYERVVDFFYGYCSALRIEGNVQERLNFIKKMDDITKKSEGSTLIDNLWYAICALEHTDLYEERNRRFFSVSYDNRESNLRIKNAVNSTLCRISKNEVEDALYYWPNTSAIRMLNKSRYIIPLLQACRDLSDEIIRQRGIA